MSPNLKNLHEFWHPWMIWKPRISYLYSMSSWGILCYCKSKIISCAFLLPLFKNFFLHRVQLNVSRSYGIFLFFWPFFTHGLLLGGCSGVLLLGGCSGILLMPYWFSKEGDSIVADKFLIEICILINSRNTWIDLISLGW